VANKGVIVITTPYLDASGFGILVTLCHSVYKGRWNCVLSNNVYCSNTAPERI